MQAALQPSAVLLVFGGIGCPGAVIVGVSILDAVPRPDGNRRCFIDQRRF